MVKKTWKVYVHTVSKAISGYDNDKRYVGITSRKDPEKRWEHGFGYRYNVHFFRAIKKYGWNNIKHEIIADNLSKEDACEMERFFIALYKANNNEYGYNNTYGGEGSLGHQISDEERKRRSERYKGENNPYYGKKHSDEVRKKMSQNHFDCSGANSPVARKVYQFDTNCNFIKCFDTVTDAAREVKINDMCIHQAVRNKGVSRGYFWCFKEGVKKTKDGIEMKEKQTVYHHNRNEVFQFDLNKNYVDRFASCNCAETVLREIYNLNISRESIFGASKRKGTAGNYIWRFNSEVVIATNGVFKLKEE